MRFMLAILYDCYIMPWRCPFQKLYTYPNNFRAYKALVAAQYSGAKVEVPKDFVFGETNKSDAFLKKFPLGKVSSY